MSRASAHKVAAQARALPAHARAQLVDELVGGDDRRGELTGQVAGYWFAHGSRIPAAPAGRPTGALLPEGGRPLAGRGPFYCLDLVPVQNYWLPLSEAGRYTYVHSWGMTRDERWLFVPVPDAVGAWPRRFAARYVETIPHASIAERFGKAAAMRARPDREAMLVELKLVRGNRR